jgi:hypothetical protein
VLNFFMFYPMSVALGFLWKYRHNMLPVQNEVSGNSCQMESNSAHKSLN